MNTRDIARYVRGALLMDLAGCPPEYATSAVAYVIAYLQGSRQPAADCYLLDLALQAQAAFGRLPVINTDDDYTDSVMGALDAHPGNLPPPCPGREPFYDPTHGRHRA